MAARRAQLLLDNDAAFRSKLDLIEGAKATVDAMYYIWQDDASSSVLTAALIEAAKRGVRVRLLLDYHTNYKRLDLFSMMERAGGAAGSLKVRFYNRPTRSIVRDAAYLTLGCATAARRQADPLCAPARLAERVAALEGRFDAERVDGARARDLGFSNLDLAHSGLFLSGWYGKRPDVMALAMVQPPSATLEAAPPNAPPSGDEAAFRQIEERIQRTTALSFLGTLLDPVQQALQPLRPSRLGESPEAARDWDHITDYLHHKLLLVDGSHMQLGGRNVEDSYHMQRSLDKDKYVFMDTDLRVELADSGAPLQRAFERLWDFRRMVATLDEVRLHAPNDFVANRDLAAQACAEQVDAAGRSSCEAEHASRPLDRSTREQRRFDEMRAGAERYRQEYAPQPREPQGWPADPGASFAYVENLPFQGGADDAGALRSYGARNGQEAFWGKRIHSLWLASLAETCAAASAGAPKQVVFHNAYFFPPSNLTQALARTMDGGLDCRHVTVTILTNSIDTTDLNVVNVLARHVLKALVEHVEQNRDPARSARFRYVEYRKPAAGANLSLHSKVTVFGDDLLVGSANTDVRSYMMDSNNALLIRRAPKLLADYLGHVERILSEPGRTQEMTGYFASASRASMRAEDQAFFRAMLAKYRAERFLGESQRQTAEQAFLAILEKVYTLTKASLAGGPDAAARAEEFNRLFKPI
jgi:phosphatidylserine/phosphatidylglycerophosphate/cardiolipin synthase-like enzyme